MALHLVIRTWNRKQRVLLATEDGKYAQTKFDLESTKLREGMLTLAKVTKMKRVNQIVGKVSR